MPTHLDIVILTTKKWHTVGAPLTVGFLDNPPLALRKRLLQHMRQELVALIDPKKATAYFKATQVWSAAEVKAQVLTPLEASSLVGTVPPDPLSIMCYQIPGTITKNGQPIIGGLDIDDTDYAFAAKMYPKQVS